MAFNVNIKEASRELSKRDILKFTDTSTATKLDKEITEVGEIIQIKPVDYFILSVHNDKVKDERDRDYTQYLILAEDGRTYLTGSESFFNSFMHIWEVMDGDDFEIIIFKLPSKNYEGKAFLTCSIV